MVIRVVDMPKTSSSRAKNHDASTQHSSSTTTNEQTRCEGMKDTIDNYPVTPESEESLMFDTQIGLAARIVKNEASSFLMGNHSSLDPSDQPRDGSASLAPNVSQSPHKIAEARKKPKLQRRSLKRKLVGRHKKAPCSLSTFDIVCRFQAGMKRKDVPTIDSFHHPRKKFHLSSCVSSMVPSVSVVSESSFVSSSCTVSTCGCSNDCSNY